METDITQFLMALVPTELLAKGLTFTARNPLEP